MKILILTLLVIVSSAACRPSSSPSVLAQDGGACGFFGDTCSDGSCCPEGYVCPSPMNPGGACEAQSSDIPTYGKRSFKADAGVK